MKVYIGPYVKHHSTSYLENKWLSYRHKKNYWDVDEKDYSLLDKIVVGWLNITNKVILGPINKFNKWRGRKVKIKIDHHDTWSMDHTLALIIAPMLRQLRDTKHGSICTDAEDVPENLRPDPNRIKLNEEGKIEHWEIDNTIHERWKWILNEMIYAFECEADDDYERKFRSGECDIYFEEKENGLSEMKTGPNDTYRFDRDAYEKDYERRKNGLKLFAKYYHGLWD